MHYKDMQKLEEDITKHIKKKCPCGHTVEIYHDKRLCTHCGKYVFKKEEDEFKYRLNEKMANKK